jgi:hypothetical protein
MHTAAALDAALDAYSATRAAYVAALDCGLDADDDDTDNARALRAAFQTVYTTALDCGLSPMTAAALIVRKIHNERE